MSDLRAWLMEHNHPKGILADAWTCPGCDALYWTPRLVRETSPQLDPAYAIATIVTSLLLSALVIATVAVWRLVL